MFYLIAQIILCLLAAFLLGALITWLFMRAATGPATEDAQAYAAASTGKLETELAAARAGTERYKVRSQTLEKDLASLRGRMEAMRGDLEKAKQSGGGDNRRVRDLEANLEKESNAGAENTKRVATLEAEAVTLRKDSHKAEEAAKAAAARAGELDALVSSQKGKLGSFENEVAGLADLRRKLHTTSTSLRQRDERIAVLENERESARTAADNDTGWKDRAEKLESDIRDRESRVTALTTDLRKAREDCADTVRQKDAEIAQLQLSREQHTRTTTPRESETQRTKKGTPERGTQRDDLKRIKGIGLVLERLLHKNDVYTFQQIANWTGEDVDRVDVKLENFKGRIRRDDWITQARKFCKE